MAVNLAQKPLPAEIDGVGVYEIRHADSGKSYIGSSVNLRRRITNHITDLKCGRHTNPHLQAAYVKYGAERFELSLLERCAEGELIQREQFWIDDRDAFRKGYNRRPDASTCKGVKFTPERLAKHHAMFTPELRKKMSDSAKGKTISDATRAKISAVHKGRKLSDEHRAKLSQAAQGRVLSQEQKDRLRGHATGRKMSDQSRAKISEALRRRAPISDETRAKLSLAAKNRSPALQQEMLENMWRARGIIE